MRLPFLVILGAILFLALSGAASLCAQPADDPKTTATPAQLFDLPEGGRPVKVRASFHLLEINAVDDEAETFEFSGVLSLVWRDSRQAFDPVTEGVEEKLSHGAFQFNELSPAWYPQVVLANASGVPEMQGVLLRVKPDGTSTLIQTVNATARSRLLLRRYPFDHQRLEAVFEVLGFANDEVELIVETADSLTDCERIQIPQWKLAEVGVSSRSLAAPYAGASGKSSAFVLTLHVERQSFFMVRLVILPLMLIVILSWSVFWMDRSSLGDRMSVSFVGLLTAVAYQLVVSDIMPQISYVTLMNGYLNFSFILMCATVVVNLVVGIHDKTGRHVEGDRIDRRCRWMFPLAYSILLGLVTAIAFIWF